MIIEEPASPEATTDDRVRALTRRSAIFRNFQPPEQLPGMVNHEVSPILLTPEEVDGTVMDMLKTGQPQLPPESLHRLFENMRPLGIQKAMGWLGKNYQANNDEQLKQFKVLLPLFEAQRSYSGQTLFSSEENEGIFLLLLEIGKSKLSLEFPYNFPLNTLPTRIWLAIDYLGEHYQSDNEEQMQQFHTLLTRAKSSYAALENRAPFERELASFVRRYDNAIDFLIAPLVGATQLCDIEACSLLLASAGDRAQSLLASTVKRLATEYKNRTFSLDGLEKLLEHAKSLELLNAEILYHPTTLTQHPDVTKFFLSYAKVHSERYEGLKMHEYRLNAIFNSLERPEICKTLLHFDENFSASLATSIVLSWIGRDDAHADLLSPLLHLVIEGEIELSSEVVDFTSFTPKLFDRFLPFAKQNEIRFETATLLKVLLAALEEENLPAAKRICSFSQEKSADLLNEAAADLCHRAQPLNRFEQLLSLAIKLDQLEELKAYLLETASPELLKQLEQTKAWGAKDSCCILS